MEARDNQPAIQRIKQPGVVREEPCSSHRLPGVTVELPRLYLPRRSAVLGAGEKRSVGYCSHCCDEILKRAISRRKKLI